MDMHKKVLKKNQLKKLTSLNQILGPNDAHCYCVNNWLDLIL